MKTDLDLAVDEAADAIRSGTMPGLAIWMAADAHGLDRSDVARGLSARSVVVRYRPTTKPLPPKLVAGRRQEEQLWLPLK